MYVLYLDESGEPSDWQNQKTFVIAGIAVWEFQIPTVGKKLRAIRKNYFPEIAFPIIFHATDIRRGKGIFRSFHSEVREKLLIDLYHSINDNRFPALVIFGAVMSIDAALNPNQVRRDTFEEVVASFNSFLVMQHRLHKTNRGLVILDRNRVEQYRDLLDSFQQEGTKYGYLANIVDIPYFARCRDTPMLQFADLCAYAMFRHYEKQDSTYLDMILPRIYRTITGKMFGMKHITKDKSCSCVSCTTQASLST